MTDVMKTPAKRKDGDRELWASGSYARVAELIVPLAEDLVALAGITPGARILDVGCGTGNAAIPAALAGGRVTASDLTPELLTAGMARARASGAALDWVEADAEELPFPDGSFDVVLSCVGAIFAPDHARAAAELLRVCRPGGRIAMANWTPDGYGGALFQLLGRHAAEAPAAPAAPATAWGDPRHVRGLLGDAVQELRCERRTFALAFDGTREGLFEVYRDCFGPVLRLRAALLGQPARLAELDDDLRSFLRGEDTSRVEYLAVIATRKPLLCPAVAAHG
jgi:SAM-dependent methyltransferase